MEKRSLWNLSPADVARFDHRVDPPVPKDITKAPAAEILALLESYNAKPAAAPVPNKVSPASSRSRPR